MMNIKWRSKLGFIFYMWFRSSGRGVNLKKASAETIRAYIEFFATNGVYFKLIPLLAKFKFYDLRKYIGGWRSLYYQCMFAYLIIEIAKKGVNTIEFEKEMEAYLLKQKDRLIEDIKTKLQKGV